MNANCPDCAELARMLHRALELIRQQGQALDDAEAALEVARRALMERGN